MKQVLEVNFIDEVGEAIGALGYKVTNEPLRIPNGRHWMNDPISLIRGPKYRPDLIVENDGKFVLIELKTGLFLLEPIIQARRHADYFGTAAIICVPEKTFADIPESVKEFAKERSVGIYAPSEIGGVLKNLLE